MSNVGRFLLCVTLCLLASRSIASEANTLRPDLAAVTITQSEVKSVLVDDFLNAMKHYSDGNKAIDLDPRIQVWIDGFEKRGVDREFLQQRFAKASAKSLALKNSGDLFAKYRILKLESVVNSETNLAKNNSTSRAPMMSAIHAVKLDVIEDYDDVSNDNVYMYFITTSDDVVWGRVTDIYKGLDEGTEVFMNAEDRGIYGPKGQKMSFPLNHVIVDVGLIESDGDDIAQLKKVSDAIVDLAIVALIITNPEAAAAAATARAEVKNLLHLIVELDTDDRLATDSLYFTPSFMEHKLATSTYYELDRVYEKETFWTHFKYGMRFRLLR